MRQDQGIAYLQKLQHQEERWIIGLMSGTSCDGIDTALCCIKGSGKATQVNVHAFQTYPYSQELKERLFKGFSNQATVQEVCRLNFEVGEAFATAVLTLLQEIKKPLSSVDLIASHGQTLYHDPPYATLQIGEADVIRERTGIPTIADFRTRDMAVGGQGAPLIAYVDYLLFQDPTKKRALQNLGGIGNVTFLAENPQEILAFDTGPANVLIDEVMRQWTCGERCYDVDGLQASQGTIHGGLLQALLQDPYFLKPLPKTTGRELFNAEYLERVLAGFSHIDYPTLLTTVTEFTAESLRDQYQRFLPSTLDEILCSGGGAQNLFLLQRIRQKFPQTKVALLEEYGYSGESKEAMAFAILGNEALMGQTSNLASVTGASRNVVLGKWSL